MKTIATVFAGFAVAGATACSPAEESEGGASSWSLSVEPALTIGEVDGASEYLFQQIVRARLMPDGRIAVADAGLSTVRVYGTGGEFVVEMGGAGEGPGEFANLRDIWIPSPDIIAAFDPRALRVTRFRTDGTLVDSRHLVPPGNQQIPGGTLDVFLGAFDDGSIATGFLAGGGGLEPGVITEDRFFLVRFDAAGSFANLMGEETFFHRTGFSGGGGAPVPFSPRPYAAVFGDSLYFSDGSRPEIEVRDWRGNVSRTIALPVGSTNVNAAFAALEAELGTEGFYTVERLRESPRPDVIPHIAGMLVDDAGYIWARAYDAPRDALWFPAGSRRFGGTWWVIDPAGEHVATVEMPDNFKPLDIRGDRIAGLTRDELDVERVAVHTIDR
ncbi:MAG: 6-bladed beta-propeller [Gemmatimonadota bacterium]